MSPLVLGLVIVLALLIGLVGHRHAHCLRARFRLRFGALILTDGWVDQHSRRDLLRRA